MSEWKPGYAYNGFEYIKLEENTSWSYTEREESYRLTLVSRDPSGQIQLRSDSMFPLTEALDRWYPQKTFDKSNRSGPVCPFVRVDAKMAKREEGLQQGDLLCHEAWEVWVDLCPVR